MGSRDFGCEIRALGALLATKDVWKPKELVLQRGPRRLPEIIGQHPFELSRSADRSRHRMRGFVEEGAAWSSNDLSLSRLITIAPRLRIPHAVRFDDLGPFVGQLVRLDEVVFVRPVLSRSLLSHFFIVSRQVRDVLLVRHSPENPLC